MKEVKARYRTLVMGKIDDVVKMEGLPFTHCNIIFDFPRHRLEMTVYYS